MQTEALRALLLAYLRQLKHPQPRDFQYKHCVGGVTSLAAKQFSDQMFNESGRWHLRGEDENRIKHVIWDLVLERVLVPGTPDPNTLNDGWPFISITDHGRKVLAETNPVPYDPDGYLAGLDKAVGGLHPSTKKYLEEAVSTFRTGNYLASAVMLGATSEMLFLELCQAITGAIADPNARAKIEEKTGPFKKMVQRLSEVTSWLKQKKSQLPNEWQRQEQVGLIDKVADLIRNYRNDAGHPQDPPAVPTHEEMYALLVVFPHYCKLLSELRAWLLANPSSIT
jgi:hypothetical protein